MTKLVDLVEWRWSRDYNAFVKVQTHKTNVPKAIAIAEKKKIEFLTPRSRLTRFTTDPNGTYQYVNQFKSGRRLKKKRGKSAHKPQNNLIGYANA